MWLFSFKLPVFLTWSFLAFIPLPSHCSCCLRSHPLLGINLPHIWTSSEPIPTAGTWLQSMIALHCSPMHLHFPSGALPRSHRSFSLSPICCLCGHTQRLTPASFCRDRWPWASARWRPLPRVLDTHVSLPCRLLVSCRFLLQATYEVFTPAARPGLPLLSPPQCLIQCGLSWNTVSPQPPVTFIHSPRPFVLCRGKR